MVVTRNLSPLFTNMDRKRNDRGLLYRVLAIYTHTHTHTHGRGNNAGMV